MKLFTVLCAAYLLLVSRAFSAAEIVPEDSITSVPSVPIPESSVAIVIGAIFWFFLLRRRV